MRDNQQFNEGYVLGSIDAAAAAAKREQEFEACLMAIVRETSPASIRVRRDDNNGGRVLIKWGQLHRHLSSHSRFIDGVIRLCQQHQIGPYEPLPEPEPKAPCNDPGPEKKLPESVVALLTERLNYLNIQRKYTSLRRTEAFREMMAAERPNEMATYGWQRKCDLYDALDAKVRRFNVEIDEVREALGWDKEVRL